ncbi:nuclear transport factor 2 family protein [Phenylobacterium sp.]|jgi:hypothetical protein|uniref:nuclear transport factor 2 family protein n=1 Tax=Phenylobacterium sp. TaxID=1871053 RepID=UPI002F3E8517
MTDEERRAVEQDCHRLVVAFHIYVDEYEHEKALAMFVDDAVMEHCVVGTLRGKAAIAAYFDAKDNTSVFQHVTSNVLIDVIDENHARGSCYWTAYVSPASPLPAAMTGPASVGRNDDTFVRTPKGWKFETRHQIPRLTASNLGSTALLKGGAAAVEKARETLGG